MQPRRSLVTLAIALLVGAIGTATFAQTTGSISGTVRIEGENNALPGAAVTAVHVPTGSRYTTGTDAEGRFRLFNVRVGGPYTVTVEAAGFQTTAQEGLQVGLGEDANIQVVVKPETIEEVITVTAEANDLINPYKTGATSTVGTQAIEDLPTISRGLEDFARLNPYFAQTASGDGPTALSVAGRNNRYNNIQIDGAVNNDLFGLAAQGTPGGQAETQPISLDAVQELQLVVSPYDVRQGGFAGGGINAITRSGTNDWSGSVFYFTRNEDWVGDGFRDVPFGQFDDTQYGFRLGGPISRDKIFFFVSGEISRREVPSGYSADGSSGIDFGAAAEAERFRSILQTRYGYDPGGLGEFTRNTDSDLFFGRVDFNLGTSQLTVRHNYVDAANDVGFQSAQTFDFPDQFYAFTDETNSTVFQLNSIFGASLFNEARVSYQTIRDTRGPRGEPFPFVLVRISGGRQLNAGPERFSTANSLDQDVLEITDDLTISSGDHTFVIGTHNELFDFSNLFIRDNFGAYEFNSLDLFEQGRASRYDYSFSATDDPQQAAAFEVWQLGLYAGDTWTVRPNFTLAYGLRIDKPIYKDTPPANPAVEAGGFGRTDVTPSEDPIYSPRLGFNWDITGKGKDQLRGGIGYFAGRAPYVWISNQYGNSGNLYTRIAGTSGSNGIVFSPDPFNQPTTGFGTLGNEINVIDSNFEFPQLFRANLAYDRDLGFWGLIASAEVIYSKTENDILYKNINYNQVGTLFDGRPRFARTNGAFGDVIQLSNTDEGEQTSALLKIERPFRDGFSWMVSYLWGEATSVNDGTSSQAASNWRFLPSIDINNPAETTSIFEIEHKFNASISYNFDIGPVGNTVSLFYNHQSGRPYSTTFSRDMNGDFQDADLIWVPATADDVIVENGTWADLDFYISSDAGLDAARGSIVSRNASVGPWTHSLDLRYALDIPVVGKSFQITFDILNLGNLIDKDSGVVRYPAFSEVSPVEFRGIDAATGKPIYRINFTDPDRRWTVDDRRSRWQAKLGARFTF